MEGPFAAHRLDKRMEGPFAAHLCLDTRMEGPFAAHLRHHAAIVRRASGNERLVWRWARRRADTPHCHLSVSSGWSHTRLLLSLSSYEGNPYDKSWCHLVEIGSVSSGWSRIRLLLSLSSYEGRAVDASQNRGQQNVQTRPESY